MEFWPPSCRTTLLLSFSGGMCPILFSIFLLWLAVVFMIIIIIQYHRLFWRLVGIAAIANFTVAFVWVAELCTGFVCLKDWWEDFGLFLVFFFPIRQVEGDPLHGDAADVALWPSACSWSLLQSYSLADYLPGVCFSFVVRRIIHTTLHIGRPSPRSLITCVHFHSITIIWLDLSDC